MVKPKHNKYTKWLKKHLFAVRTVLLVLVMIVFTAYSMAWGFQRRHADDTPRLGVSFSIKYANELGVDWQTTYLTLLDELDIEYLRLMSYWDTIEPTQGEFDFEDLDWQFDQAARHGAHVTLAIGQRQPRWPECHVPEWALELDDETYKQAVLEMLEVVSARYHDHPALASYQLENEYANRHFGECPRFDNTFLDEEVDVVKAQDPDDPLTINTSNQSGIPLQEPTGERTGFSVYKRSHFDALGKSWRWTFWYVPSWWHSLRAALVEGLHDNYVFIHELQGEPWGTVETVYLSDEEQGQTMDPDKLIDIVEFAKATGMHEIYLWGGEWWYWRKTQFNDDKLWQTVKQLYEDANNSVNW